MELSDSFLKGLISYDQFLKAHYDSRDDAIYIWAERPGKPKVHELRVTREFGECYPELEHRALKKLRECDVWKRFGTGKAYDDFLAKEEEDHRLRLRQSYQKERASRMKEDRELWRAAIWNAQHGRFTKKTALPYQTSTNFAFNYDKAEFKPSKK